jgi:hypothetical protein
MRIYVVSVCLERNKDGWKTGGVCGRQEKDTGGTERNGVGS